MDRIENPQHGGAPAQRNKLDRLAIISIYYYMHLGCSVSFLTRVPFGENGKYDLTPRKIENATINLSRSDILARRVGVEYFSISRAAGNQVTSIENLIEYSIFASCLYYHHGELVYEGLCLDEIVAPYNMYTNLRKSCRRTGRQISLELAYYIARELHSFLAVIAQCDDCDITYYSSSAQGNIANGCPFCRRPGKGDCFGINRKNVRAKCID